MNLIHLKSALEQHVGFQINTIAACRRLEQLLIKQGYYVSYTTLSRIFGLAKINSHARPSTLDELTRFLGYIDYNNFLKISNEREENNRKKLEALLTIESLFLEGNEAGAIRQLIKYKNEQYEVFNFASQFISYYLFDSKNKHPIAFKELLFFEEFTLYLIEHYVFEDDCYGQYNKLLYQLSNRQSKNLKLFQFHELFKSRKELLRGKEREHFFQTQDLGHFHLQSRNMELELLGRIHSSKYIINKTEEILHLITDWKEADFALAFVGRWCRGLIYTEQYQLLQDHMGWKEQCIALLQIQEINKEFQAVIYTFLALTYGYHGSLAFMYNGEWENAKLESKLLLSLAFKQHDAFKIYKRLLGYV